MGYCCSLVFSYVGRLISPMMDIITDCHIELTGDPLVWEPYHQEYASGVEETYVMLEMNEFNNWVIKNTFAEITKN